MDQLQNKLFDLSARNPFINVKLKQLYFNDIDANEKLANLYKSANFFKKEYGIETSLQLTSFLRWKDPNRDKFFTSPLVIQACSIVKVRKIETEYKIDISEEQKTIVNPILVYSLKRFYDIDLEGVEQENLISKLISDLSTIESKVEVADAWNERESWQIIETSCVGNFNYKKSLLGTDFDQIKQAPSKAIVDLFNGQRVNEDLLDIDVKPILELDFSQKEAIEISESRHLALQGPPGTGKSHTIVGLIGHFLSQNKKVLFVSQKKSALEVVMTRLKDLNLDYLAAYLNTEKDEKKSFYQGLLKTWNTLSENHLTKEKNSGFIDDVLSKYYLKRYTTIDPVLGESPYNLISDLLDSGFLKSELKPAGDTPSLIEWRESEEFLIEFEEGLKIQFSVDNISKSSFIHLNKAVFTEKNPLIKLSERLDVALTTLDDINKLQKKYTSGGNLTEFTKLALAGSILNMVNKTQLDLLNTDSKSYKAFSNSAKKYQLLKSRVERAEVANSKWSHKPTKSEITELTDLIKHNHAPRGILGILKRKNERLARAFEGFDSHISDVTKLQMLEQLRSEWNLKGELAEQEIKLKHNFNVLDPENEIGQILQLRTKLNEISHNVYMEILEHEDSVGFIIDLSKIHPKIQHFNHINKFIFTSNLESNLLAELDRIKKIKSELFNLKTILPQLEKFFILPSKVRNFVVSNSKPINELSAICMYANLVESSRFDKGYSKLSGENLRTELSELEKWFKESNQQNIDELRERYFANYKSFEELLSTPSSKLKIGAKEQKKEIRKSKKTFIHEINKKQQHMPIKKFVADNWQFISDLVPLWIMNPLAVSERLNCEPELFDVVIFDEASQIPLEDAVPAIQRAKRIIVVGDEKQMPPSSFFSSSSDSITILDQANQQFQKNMLKWHYRSEHFSLIEFSNYHFYENELMTMPPVNVEVPIEIYKCEGVFNEGVNTVEAEEIAKYLSSIANLKRGEFAVITFSKEQENLIRKKLQDKKVDCENILIRNLENVQGIERDNVLISIGYAKNLDGKFRLNFGPVNQVNGSNRLNVMFTRAKKKIVLFTSVSSTDFGLSDNQGVSCLRDYLRFAENLQEKSDDLLPTTTPLIDTTKYKLTTYSFKNGSSVNCFVQHKTSKVLLFDPCLTSQESQDIQTIYSIMKSRFKTTKILLSIDAWNNPEHFENELERYFG